MPNTKKQHIVRWPTAVIVCFFVSIPGRTAPDIALPLSLEGSRYTPINGADTPFRKWHPEGLSYLNENPRTPTGFLYGHPRLQENADDNTLGSWTYGGMVEFGALGVYGNRQSSAFSEYSDWTRGLLLSQFSFRANQKETGAYIGFAGGSVGRDDQYFRAKFGRLGKYKISAQFQSLRHVFTTKAKVLWEGAGSNYLKLPAGITPGNANRANVEAALFSTPKSRVSLTREKGGISANVKLSKRLNFDASISHEWRKGTRPFGVGFSYPAFGQVLEAVEPINYQTTDVQMGLNYSKGALQARIHYTGSFFHNENRSLTVENPGLSPSQTNYTAPRGRFALAPNNSYHRISADVVAPLSFWNASLTASTHYSVSSQNDDLLPPTINSGLVPVFGSVVDLSQWNSVEALNTRSANAQSVRLTFISKLQMTPSRKWRISLKIRYDDQNNKTNYTAFNPLTGQYGYIALDGGLAGAMPRLNSVYTPATPGHRLRYRNMPFTKDIKSLSALVTYRFSSKTKMAFTAGYKQENRRPREVEETRDMNLKASFTSRALKVATMRLSYSFTNRGGSDYIANPYEAYYTSSLPGYIPRFPDGDAPHTLSEFRKFDLVAKHIHVVKAKVNFIASETMDIALTGMFTRQSLQADFGLRQIGKTRLNTEVTWHPSSQISFYAYASYEHAYRDVSNVRDAGQISSDGSAGGAVYPRDNFWSVAIKEKGLALGTGLRREFYNWDLDINYTFAKNRSLLAHDYASQSALAGGITPTEAGSQLPDQFFQTHILSTVLRWRIKDDLQVRFLYRFEHEDLDAYHYQGLNGSLAGNDIYLGLAPENYSSHVAGVFLAIKY